MIAVFGSLHGTFLASQMDFKDPPEDTQFHCIVLEPRDEKQLVVIDWIELKTLLPFKTPTNSGTPSLFILSVIASVMLLVSMDPKGELVAKARQAVNASGLHLVDEIMVVNQEPGLKNTSEYAKHQQ